MSSLLYRCLPRTTRYRILFSGTSQKMKRIQVTCKRNYYSLYCGRVPAAKAPGCTAAKGLLHKPWSLVVPTCTARCLHQTLIVKGGTTWARNGLWILPENARLPSNNHGSFTCRKSTTWDKRPYFPKEGVVKIFFRPEKSDGFGRVWSRELGVPKASTLYL